MRRLSFSKAGKIAKKLFCLPPLPTVLVSVPSFALVIYVLSRGETGALAYAAYLASAYALIVFLTGLPQIVRAAVGWARGLSLTRRLLEAPAARRFFGDVAFRTRLMLWQGLAVNLLYAALKLVSGILYHSAWFLALAAYYALLAAMRVLLLWHRAGAGGELPLAAQLRRCRLCGWVLLWMNAALAGMVSFLVKEEGNYDYPGVLIYAMAAYAFYAVITAVISLFQYRKYGSPLLSASRAVGLVTAMVSMLALETALLSRFGKGDAAFRVLMTNITGGVVCTLVLGMAIYMLMRSTRQLRRLKPEHE